jgi:NhaP-type Na+/H+ or K+/H+ antiporter
VEAHSQAGLVFALALGAGMVAQLLARHARVPSIVFLLGAGVLLGPDGLGLVQPRELGDGLLAIVQLAVAVILFEGGLNLELERLRRAGRAIQLLVTLGAFITACGAGLAAYWIMDWPWRQALLFGTLVIVTGPTVIRPILRNVPLRGRLATLLEAEGVLIDPVGAIVAGWLLGQLLRRPQIVPEGLENLVALGGALVLYTGSNAYLSESGILAVTVAGVVVGNLGPHAAGELREFEERLTLALLGVLFVLLAADVRMADVTGLGLAGAATVAAVMLLVRPLNVMACTWRSGLDVREKVFLAWIGPRGIVAAAVASLAAVLMEAGQLEGGAELRALVFLTIAITVVVQGGSAPLAARLLDVRAPARANLAILGAEDLALALGEELRREGGDVVFVDANPGHCAAAEERGFVAVFGNALDERVLARARLERCWAAIGLTANDQVNSLFAREARDDFQVPDTYVALARGERGVTPRILEKQASRLLFDGPKDVERWNVRFRHGMAQVRRFGFRGAEDDRKGAGALAPSSEADPFLFLALERGAVCEPMHAAHAAKPGDVARVAIYRAQQDEAVESLARLGWEPAAQPEDDA